MIVFYFWNVQFIPYFDPRPSILELAQITSEFSERYPKVWKNLPKVYLGVIMISGVKKFMKLNRTWPLNLLSFDII